MSGYTSPELDKALEDAAAATDRDVMCQHYEEAQRIIMENALDLGVFAEGQFYGTEQSVKGFKLGPMAWMYYPYMIRMEE